MKITEAKVIVCRPGRNLVPLKVMAEVGIYGLGDATRNGREAVSFPKKELFCGLLGIRDKRHGRARENAHFLVDGAHGLANLGALPSEP